MASRFTAQNLCESQWNIADLLDFCSFDRSHSPEMPMVYWWSENLRELVKNGWRWTLGLGGPAASKLWISEPGPELWSRRKDKDMTLGPAINWNGAISISQHAQRTPWLWNTYFHRYPKWTDRGPLSFSMASVVETLVLGQWLTPTPTGGVS